jgi:uncharacterized protein (DUF305 family)
MLNRKRILNVRNREGHKMMASIIFAFALVIGTVISATAQTQEAGSAPNRGTARYEIDFMQDMIDHHAMAIMMSEMCLEKAVHDELRTLCQEIISAQQQEITEMQSWLLEWYGISYSPQMKPGEMRMMEKMAQMSGAEFEIEFMEMMIKHHLKAIREASKCVDRVYHGQLRELCENIITSQAAEIEQMRTWLCQWYGICTRG